MLARTSKRIAARALAMGVLVATLSVALLASHGSAFAAEQPRPEATLPSDGALRWDPQHRRFRGWQYVSTGVMFSVFVLNLVGGGAILPQVEGHWTRRNSFDNAFQDALRVGSFGGRKALNTVSDVAWYASNGFALLLDPLLVWAYRKSPEVAWQMWLITAQSMSLSGFVGSLVVYAGRERPFVRRICNGPDAPSSGLENCSSSGRYRSFYSGHASATFTAAAVSCAHHLYNDIYGRAGDIGVCAAGLTLGTTVGMFRVMADRHYMTDVLLGAAVGLTSGFLVPWLLHYRKGAARPRRAADGSFSTFGPLLSEDALGVSYLGAF